jgi:hypothetical protein
MVIETNPNPKNGDLQVYWIPQVPMKAFKVPVNNLREAKFLLNTLADYDIFQYENHIKPDYCNTGGLLIYDESEKDWVDWESDDGRNIDEIEDNEVETVKSYLVNPV